MLFKCVIKFSLSLAVQWCETGKENYQLNISVLTIREESLIYSSKQLNVRFLLG